MILVTGSAGLVGNLLTKRLNEIGLPHTALIREDIDLSEDNILSKLRIDPPNVVVHLAAALPFGANRRDDQQTADKTRRIDENVALAASAWGSRVIYASTCLLYSRRNTAVNTESSPLIALPTSPYSQAKLDGEKIFGSFPDSLIFRLSAPVGPKISPTLVLSKFIHSAVNDESLEVWGTGLREQDFVDLFDVTEFILAAIVAKKTPPVLNVVSSRPVSMLELAVLVVETIGAGNVKILRQEKIDPLEGDFARYSSQLAFEALGWKSQKSLRSSIEEISEIINKGNR